MHMPWKNKQLNQDGDQELLKYEQRLQKYLDRMYDIVQCKAKKYAGTTEDGIFKELDKVIACQLNLEADQIRDQNTDIEAGWLTTHIPLVDIIVNIDLFTAHFEDRNKVLRIVKELFNHCTTMKRLLQKHSKLILTNLMYKYDKKCHLYINAQNKSAQAGGAPKPSEMDIRDEFLAVIIGQLIRLYAKSKSMSAGFQNFQFLDRIVELMQHEQYIIQSDA